MGGQEGFADDYSFLIRGLLDLFEASQDQQWLQWAWQLQEKQDQLFWDEGKGGYFNSTTNDPSILLRVKEGQWGRSVRERGREGGCGGGCIGREVKGRYMYIFVSGL